MPDISEEQKERERRANIHRWFSHHINIELEPWQLDYICSRLDLRDRRDPTAIEGEPVEDQYEVWKRNNERWIRESNARALERELENAKLILREGN